MNKKLVTMYIYLQGSEFRSNKHEVTPLQIIVLEIESILLLFSQ